MSRLFQDAIAGIDRLVDELETAALRALEQGARDIQGVAVATDAYQDQTGATRASTTAYVASSRGGGAATLRQAAGRVRFLRFGDDQEALEPIPAPPLGTLRIILTVPTDYQIDLETSRGGARAFVGPVMLAEQAAVFALIRRELSEVFG